MGEPNIFKECHRHDPIADTFTIRLMTIRGSLWRQSRDKRGLLERWKRESINTLVFGRR